MKLCSFANTERAEDAVCGAANDPRVEVLQRERRMRSSPSDPGIGERLWEESLSGENGTSTCKDVGASFVGSIFN